MKNARFKQSDLTRAVRGVRKAGLKVGSVEIDQTGRIVILSDQSTPKQNASEWDVI